MKNTSLKVSIFVLLVSFAQLLNAEASWQLDKDENGIKVYVRDSAGSAVQSFKGVVNIPARIPSIVTALEDTKSYPLFLHNCKTASDLKTVSDSESFKYIVTNMPWPVKDRDMIVHSLMSQDRNTKKVSIKMNADVKLLAQKPGLVRISQMKGSWSLVPAAKGTVKVTYEMNVDPGGNLPKWLVNSLAVDIPFHTLRKLREQLKKPVYENAKHAVIID